MSRATTTHRQTSSGASRQGTAPRFEHIQSLIDDGGDIAIGRVGPIRCAATATTEDQSLAMLVRRDGETFLQLLARLDAAIEKALDEEIYIDEINNGPSSSP